MPLPYTIREGIAGFRRARFSAAASTAAMAVALILVGVFVLTYLEAQIVSSWLRQRVGEVELFLENADPRTVRMLHTRAAAYPGVVSVDYISPAEAHQIFRREFGEGAEAYFDQLFLPASIRIRVAPEYANSDSLKRLAKEFGSWNRVEEVVFNQPLLVKIQENIRFLTLAGVTLGSLVILAAIFLIANTIRLTIYARRLLIRTMKLVGATDRFIQIPFLVEGVIQGILAGLLAGILLWIILGAFSPYLPPIGNPATHGFLLTLLLMFIGMALGYVGSLFAVRRFLKTVSLH